jgi:predicted metallopeptidase
VSTEYSYAAEVEEVARELIAEHHQHLEDERIEYIFRSKATLKGGKTVLGKARKISGLNAFLAKEPNRAGPFFVIEVPVEEWKELTPEQRKALVDHELSHCDLTDEGELQITPHDVEEFAAVVERHGFWTQDVAVFANAVQQHLPGLEAA